ncbi:MAG: glycine--tRNA ligase [Candidatus Andersenbacteria bacterium]
MADIEMEKIVALAKHRGFIFPGSEIYGGLANSWDYGPLGTLLKNNLRDAWWKFFVQQRRDMVGLDAAILMNPEVWKASGHVANFNDPLIDCKSCQTRWRADTLLAQQAPEITVAGLSFADLQKLFAGRAFKCPQCGANDFTEVRRFNLLFETSLGVVEGQKQTIFLRGELAQAMFVDFKRVMESMRKQLPFGIAQVGRVFRNEITPGNFIYRTLEFDLMEFEYFIAAENWQEMFDYWLERMQHWAVVEVGLTAARLRVREHQPHELAHYSSRTADIEYETPFGWKELFGLAYRGDFDLKNHAEKSGQDLQVLDPKSGEKYYPHVVEPTFGLTRLVLMTLLDAYHEEEVEGQLRVVLRFKPQLAPYQVAILPLSKKEELMKVALPLADELSRVMSVDYDVTQSIGKRYRRQDEIGTPYCVTIDFATLQDDQATVRERDSMKQERIALSQIASYLHDKLRS